MQPCDVNGQNCAGQSEDTQVCGSCMRNICDGCTEALTTIEDEYGHHYLVPMSMGDEESFGNIPVCPACAHLELFKTTANTNNNLALEHILSQHPEGNLEDVSGHGELDDYHDALHYGDTDEETKGVSSFPNDHEGDVGNLKLAAGAHIPGEIAKEKNCSSCGQVGLPIVNHSTGESWCSNCKASLTPSASSASAPASTATPPAGSGSSGTFNPTSTGLLVPGPPAAPTNAGPTRGPGRQWQPPAVPPLPAEHYPGTPIDIAPIKASFKYDKKGRPIREGSAGFGVNPRVPGDHPHAAMRPITTEIRPKDIDKYEAGRLSPEEELLGEISGRPFVSGKARRKTLELVAPDSSGRPTRGLHPDHWEDEKKGHSVLYAPGITCHACGKSFMGPPALTVEDTKMHPLEVGHKISSRPSFYDTPEQQAKALGIIERTRQQKAYYTNTNRAYRKDRESNPLNPDYHKRTPGRPRFDEDLQDEEGFEPLEEPGGYQFIDSSQPDSSGNPKKISKKQITLEEIEKAYQISRIADF